MRMLLRVQMDVEAGNRAIIDGSWASTMQRVMEDLRPEAAYFLPQDGKRTALMVFDLKDPSEIPVVAEPFFEAVNASVELTPVMTVEDLQAGLQRISRG